MSDPSPLETLFLPFEQNVLPWPDKVLFIGAQYHAALKNIPSPILWQVFKPFSDSLKRDGLLPSDTLPVGTFDMVLCLVPKQLDEAKFWIAGAIERLNDNGTLVLSAANDAFGARLKKWMEEAGIQSIQTESKNKAKVVWGVKGQIDQILMQEWLDKGAVRTHDFGDGLMLKTLPGIFSWDRIDPASRLLAQNLPRDMRGKVADFGSGYGYLSLMTAKNCPRIEKMTLIEADQRARACAEENLKNHTIEPLWHDLTKSLPPAMIFDHIIMNPPFHTGKKTDTALGQAFIATASKHLKKNGSLYMVANAHLPYESILQKSFSSVVQVMQQDGFKIIKAVK